ncbi:bleomycin resistance protein [Paucilactobacillus vaccinostercus DSM 20634]|uniref:Bleomycin resistance protein n=1 Tax=Paucilactobacillus vaccinostercus DSM 20634 TaxID=1423813 RepID=A0A0R2AD65_9LACO|nr:VOC family protein [Paucilactobacillus vaccinostercus]KRM61622.1 bleomycin resistance protein [Paucilactobacillus vaccinostercus DSM 20634]
MQIHHISVLASNFTSNHAFYTHTLGLRLVKDTVNQENPAIEHLFYGDYLGSPGTVITFFIIPYLGHRTDGNHSISDLILQIPRHTSDWWAQWLTAQHVAVTHTADQLTFDDLDEFHIILREGDAQLTTAQINPASPVPAQNQIVKILGTHWLGPDPAASARFFDQFIAAPTDATGQVQLADHNFIGLKKAPTQQRTRFGRGSVDHLALQVADDQQLFAYWQKAVQQGWQLELFRNRHWFKSIYLRDPSDNRLELATPAPGFTVDEPLDQLGTHLVLPPWLADQRAEIEQRLQR